MYTPLEALYTYATKCGDLTHWLPNQDIIDTYLHSTALAEKLSDRLMGCLAPEDKSLFQKQSDNLSESHRLETEMLFYQGLAMGLQLGALSLWV